MQNKGKKYNKKQKKQNKFKYHNKINNQQVLYQRQDERFKNASYDPKFMLPSKNITKVKIDSRFSKMINNPQFTSIQSKVDKYGRKNMQSSTNQKLKDYYYQEEQSEKEQLIQSDRNLQQWMQDYNEISSSDNDNELSEQINKWVEEQQPFKQLWRQEEQIVQGEQIHASKRLALCNYDWMNLNSKDLMLLFNSFKPNIGYICSVKVYYSEYGKQKIKNQEMNGPQDLWQQNQQQQQIIEGTKTNINLKNILKKTTNEEINQNRIRSYQKQRLKYFYAVIECDSIETADEIYKQCDGNQYQNSNLLIDLRFIPDEVQFQKDNFKEICNILPINGEVKNFISRAIGHSKVPISWEDPQLSTLAHLKRTNWNKLKQDQIDNIDWSIYLNEGQMQEEDQIHKILNVNKNTSQNQIQTESLPKKYHKKQHTRKNDDIQISFTQGFQNNIKDELPLISLKQQQKSKKQRQKAAQLCRKAKKQELQLLTENKKQLNQFKININDQRFKAVYNNPTFSIDPTNNKFDHRKIGNIFQQVVKNNKNKILF